AHVIPLPSTPPQPRAKAIASRRESGAHTIVGIVVGRPAAIEIVSAAPPAAGATSIVRRDAVPADRATSRPSGDSTPFGSGSSRRPVPSSWISYRCGDRKSTRLNSSHVAISYAVFCLKKKKEKQARHTRPVRVQNVQVDT